MKQIAEFLPIAAFVAAYYLSDIYFATAVFMGAVSIQLIWYLVRREVIPTQMKFIFVIAWVFGGLTLILHDKSFIQWKPTIVNWAMALALIASHFFGQDNFIKKMLGAQMTLPDSAWTHLNFGWAFGFIISGILNLVVAFNFSEAFWVNYKLIGGIAITFSYVAIMLIYLHRNGYLEAENLQKEQQIIHEPSAKAGKEPSAKAGKEPSASLEKDSASPEKDSAALEKDSAKDRQQSRQQ
ncbi:MAG: septation protein IspZ [Pseudomonadales bacterium]|nr:septation protein IspZ [Pseudomonadales bacterium]